MRKFLIATLLVKLVCLLVLCQPLSVLAESGSGGGVDACAGDPTKYALDANGDTAIDISDVIWSLSWMFSGGQVPQVCLDSTALEESLAAAQAAQATAEGERDAALAAQATAEGERDAALAAQATAEGERDAALAAQATAEGERDAALAAQATAEAELAAAIGNCQHVLTISGPSGASGSGVLSSTFSVDLTGDEVQAYTFGLSSSDAASIVSVTTDGTAAAGAGFVDIRDGENGSGACQVVAVVVDFTGAGGVVGTGDSLLSITAEDDGVQPRDITLSLGSCSGPGDEVVPTVTVAGVSRTPATNDKTYSIAGSDYGLTVQSSQDLFSGDNGDALPIDFTVTNSGSDVQAVQLGVTYEGTGSITGITSDDAALLIVELGTTSGGDACSVVAALRDLTGTGATWGDGDTVLVVATTQDAADPGTVTVGIGSVCDAGGEPTSAKVTVAGESFVPWTVDKTVNFTGDYGLAVQTSQDLFSGDSGTALPIDFTVTNTGGSVQAVQLGVTYEGTGSITGITSDDAALLIVELGTTSGGDACSVVAALRDLTGTGATWADGDTVLVVATTQDAATGTATVGIGSACDAGGEPTSALVTVGGDSIVPWTEDKTVSISGN